MSNMMSCCLTIHVNRLSGSASIYYMLAIVPVALTTKKTTTTVFIRISQLKEL